MEQGKVKGMQEQEGPEDRCPIWCGIRSVASMWIEGKGIGNVASMRGSMWASMWIDVASMWRLVSIWHRCKGTKKQWPKMALMWIPRMSQSMWHRCGIDVASMWHRCGIDVCIDVDRCAIDVGRCGIDVASMSHWCGIDVISMWHRCGIDVASMWHRSGIDVASMWH